MLQLISCFNILEGRKKGKDIKTVTKKKRAASGDDDDEQRGNVGNNSQKASKKQKVNQEKEGRKGQKVIIFHQFTLSLCDYVYFFFSPGSCEYSNCLQFKKIFYFGGPLVGM